MFWGTVGSSLPLVKVPRAWLQELGVQSTVCVCYPSRVMELPWWDVLLRKALSLAELAAAFSILFEGHNLASFCNLPEMHYLSCEQEDPMQLPGFPAGQVLLSVLVK